MARINIEECWWSDPRRTALLLSIGFEADSAAVNMWRTAQEFWGDGRRLVPAEVFYKLKHAQALIDAGLADVQDAFVYVRGSSEWLEWHAQKREQAAAAGKRSAEVRRQKNGSAQPSGGRGHQATEREPNENRTERNETEPSGSGSGLEKTPPIGPLPGEMSWPKERWFLLAHDMYTKLFPGTKIGQKAEERLKEQIKTDLDFDQLLAAIGNYAEELGLEQNSWRKPKTTFANFLGTRRSGYFWRDYIERRVVTLQRKTHVTDADVMCGIAED